MAHILAIDDDPGILALIEHALRREGHTITCMPHVPADLAAHLAEYDLILLDVMMPQTDGYELCSAIRDDTDCPILFLTAKTMEEDVDYGFSVGADDYIKKPFSIVELRARVAAHLRREQREKHHCLSIQGIRFLLASREVAQAVSRSPLPGRSMRSHFCSQKPRADIFQGADLRSGLRIRQDRRCVCHYRAY